jgi:multiple sugar transport system permease protein
MTTRILTDSERVYRRTVSRIPGNILVYVILIVGTVIALFPFYWMISSSLKENWEILSFPPTLWPHTLTFTHYQSVLSTIGIVRAFINSIVVVASRVFIVLMVALITGYSLAKLRFPGREVLFVLVLALMMVPGQIYLIPLFLLVNHYGWIDTYAALIIPGAINSFSIFLMRQAFLSVPNDYIDAALVDGAGHFRILFKIGLPMVAPMVLTLVLVNAFWSWNDFIWPFIVIVRDEMSTLPVLLARFARLLTGPVGRNIRYGEVMAAATLTSLPILVVFLLIQRMFVESLTMTGLKG